MMSGTYRATLGAFGNVQNGKYIQDGKIMLAVEPDHDPRNWTPYVGIQWNHEKKPTWYKLGHVRLGAGPIGHRMALGVVATFLGAALEHTPRRWGAQCDLNDAVAGFGPAVMDVMAETGMGELPMPVGEDGQGLKIRSCGPIVGPVPRDHVKLELRSDRMGAVTVTAGPWSRFAMANGPECDESPIYEGDAWIQSREAVMEALDLPIEADMPDMVHVDMPTGAALWRWNLGEHGDA